MPCINLQGFCIDPNLAHHPGGLHIYSQGMGEFVTNDRLDLDLIALVQAFQNRQKYNISARFAVTQIQQVVGLLQVVRVDVSEHKLHRLMLVASIDFPQERNRVMVSVQRVAVFDQLNGLPGRE